MLIFIRWYRSNTCIWNIKKWLLGVWWFWLKHNLNCCRIPQKQPPFFFSISANLFALKWIFLMTFAHLLLQKLFVGLQQTNISFKDVNTMESFESFHSKNRAVVYICEHWLTLNNYLYMESLDSFHCKRGQLYRGSQLYWWRKPEKATCCKSLTNFITLMLYRVHLANYTFVRIGLH